MSLRDEVQALSLWYRKKGRKLPWRETSDPYKIWISEVMLQQTQVATVIPYYHRFLARFPTIEALATAEESQVLTHWSGLGYYSRAKNLHRGAKAILNLGAFPKTRDEILNIPGIGPYTAGAILSISFNLPVPLVDGNVQRVFARYYGMRTVVSEKSAQNFFWDKAQKWVETAEAPKIINQALMELGATICTKGQPQCTRCPLSAGCIALKKSWQLELPVKKARRKIVELHWVGLILQKPGQLLLKQNLKGEWWAGLWDFPRWEEESAPNPTLIKKRLLKHYADTKCIIPLNGLRHTVTHHKIHMTPYWLQLPAKAKAPKGMQWVSTKDIAELPLSSLAKKLLGQLETN